MNQQPFLDGDGNVIQKGDTVCICKGTKGDLKLFQGVATKVNEHSVYIDNARYEDSGRDPRWKAHHTSRSNRVMLIQRKVETVVKEVPRVAMVKDGIDISCPRCGSEQYRYSFAAEQDPLHKVFRMRVHCTACNHFYNAQLKPVKVN